MKWDGTVPVSTRDMLGESIVQGERLSAMLAHELLMVRMMGGDVGFRARSTPQSRRLKEGSGHH